MTRNVEIIKKKKHDLNELDIIIQKEWRPKKKSV